MPLTNGQTFAGYTIVRLLGSGGMGEVYLAEHPRLPRRDALKLLPREWSRDEEFRARFNREADLASTLWHPHIVGVHDRGEEDGQLWISMDFVDGLDAARLLADRHPAGMPVEEVVRIVTAVASALDYAHKQDLLHRDVKPANIMMTHLDDDGEQRILLTDFGIARNANDISGLTKTNFTVGTVAYSAPEQLMGEDVDGRADQYSLAATAFHLLTSSELFPNSNPAVVISRHLNVPPPAVADKRPELAALDPVLAVGLAKRPDGRFRSCSEFARALSDRVDSTGASSAATHVALQPSEAPPASAASPPAKSTAGSRRTWALAGGVAATIVLIGAAIVMWREWQHNSPHAGITAVPQPGASSSPIPGPPPPASPTRANETDIQTTTAVVNGQPAIGFREVHNSNADLPLNCETTSKAAVTANVYYCSPNSASADICWSAPPRSMLCLDNPWDKELRRFPLSTFPLPSVQHGVDPWPYALELDNGARCRLLVGMRDVRPDGDIPEYGCGSGQSGFAVLMSRDSTNPINRSLAIWTVKAGPLGSMAQTRTVTKAWFVGAE
ncbi:serine/threonine protein kinase [Mycobacterium ahvazicum]|uniref:non-specific serine/threonine protein kinase n=1 Tax=Mycobacterium ahvazicum TaxID=1964395 RepID=A0A2K4YAL3_9MYCO|nr:serine/threonine-protein kinase [Mycobacterium ahvazicum]SOX53824.1 serine/threonine protein kinase [Mycobacterium ahvazicum]